MPVAAAAAVAAAKTGRRVRYSLNRNDDMRINGGALVPSHLPMQLFCHILRLQSFIVTQR